MALSDKIEASIEMWSTKWKDRMRGFLVDILSIGFDAFFKVLGKSFSPKLTPLINRLESAEDLPDEIRPLLAELKNPTGEVAALLGQSLSGAAIGTASTSFLDPLLRPLGYFFNRLYPNAIFDINGVLQSYLRGLINDETLKFELSSQGFNDSRIQRLLSLTKKLWDIGSAVNLWRRGALSDIDLASELKKQGYDESKIQGIKVLSEVLPSVSDIIRFAVREAYSPEIAEKFGQYDDFPTLAMPDAKKVGLTEDLMRKQWAAHWDLPGPNQGFDMLHRGIIDSETLKLLLRALDVMPYWRDKLIQLAYTPYTRVDARRMWDLGVLDDEELKRSYLDIGYDEKHANTMVLWTKIFQTFPDLIARYKNGYISLEDVTRELKGFGLPDDRIKFLIETKVKPESASRIQKERDLTKAEIIKGLNKGVIQRADATALLRDMGYDENEAEFIININLPASDTKKALAAKELTKSDIISGLKSGILAQEDALSQLIKIRYVPDDAQYIINLALATIKVPVTAKEKELTKTDITKGVKLGLITPEQGYLMLQDIGYSPDNAAYILILSSPSLAGSPDNYSEFKQLTQSYRASQGMPTVKVSDELVNAEWEVRGAKAALELGKKNQLPDDRMASLSSALANAETRYRQLLEKSKGR